MGMRACAREETLILFDIYTIVGLICIAAALRFYKGQTYHYHLSISLQKKNAGDSRANLQHVIRRLKPFGK